MSDEDKMLVSVAQQIAEAITTPYKLPSASQIESLRQDTIASLRDDLCVASAEANPDDPLGIIVVAKSTKPISYIKLNVIGPAPSPST